MSVKKKIHNALTAVFPTRDALSVFSEDSSSRQSLQSFIDLAARHGLIESPDRLEFEAFILANRRPVGNTIADGLTMEELINDKDEHLDIKISNRSLTNKINLLLSKNGIKLPTLNGTMLTRLKKQAADTPRKRDALRSLAFWIGYERSYMGAHWHLETLRSLCLLNQADMKKTVNATSGVRIAFSINSRGSVIGQDITLWLKRTIKKVLSQRPAPLFDAAPAKVKYYDLATYHVDLPNPDGGIIPAAYSPTLKEAIAIAYHLSIQWMISGFAGLSRFCFVGIAAGDFSELNAQLQTILSAKLPDDPPIRLTNYARQAVMINEIKVTLDQISQPAVPAGDASAKVWWIRELSSILYWDLAPGILKGDYLDEDKPPYLKLKRQLLFKSTSDLPPGCDAPASVFINFPHHSMLGFEVVRTLFCKNRLMEALEIVNVLLKINPDHVSSRVMRMMIYKIFALDAMNYRLADMMFRRAENEAQYIGADSKQMNEDFYYEYAMLKLARLAVGIKVLRKYPDGLAAKGLRVTAAELLAHADAAEEILMHGISVSLSVARLYYLFYVVHVLKIVLAENVSEDGTFNPRLTCPNNIIKHYMMEVLISSTKYQKYPARMPDINTYHQIITDMMRHYGSAPALDIFKPMLHFSSAIVFWDLMPVRTVAFVLSTLKALKSGIKAAEALASKGELLFSNVSMTGQIVKADAYISQVMALTGEIEKRCKKASELEKMDPAQLIDTKGDDLVLMTYHV